MDTVAPPVVDELAKIALLSIAFLGTNGNVSFIVFIFYFFVIPFFNMLRDLYNEK